MKNILFILLTLIIISSCQQPASDIKKYYTTVEAPIVGMKLIQVYPNINPERITSRVHITEKRDKDSDFLDGIAYNENGFPVDGIVHELDLSVLLNNKPGEIFLYCEWLDGAENESFNCFFKPKGLNVAYENVSISKNANVRLLNLVTDENSKIEWYHNYTQPFDGRIPESDPDYHDYNAISFRIMIYYYETGGEINN